MSWRKCRKVQKLFCSNKKRSDKIDKDGKESVVNISYKIKFIDCSKFMASSLSNLADTLSEEFTKLNVKTAIVFLNMKVSRTICWNINVYYAIKIFQTKMDEELKKKFKNTFEFSNNEFIINKFILLLRQVAYP